MGSLVMAQVVSDIGRPPHTDMLRGGHSAAAPESSSARPHHETPSADSYHTTSTSRSGTAPYTPSSISQSDNSTPVATARNPSEEPASPSIHPSAPPESLPDSQRPSHDARNYDQAGFPLTSNPGGLSASSPSSPRLRPTWRSSRSLGGSEATSPSRIKIKDLSHIQSMASQEMLAPRSGYRPSGFLQEGRQYEISEMPVSEIIEMVAGLLTKITTTNDRQHEHLHRQIPNPDETAGLSQQTTSVLAFHGKNVPSITILSYLSRIHKYCPTTYEVFLSLLVYFDRMTETVNREFLQDLRREDMSPTSPQADLDIGPMSPTSESGDSSPVSSESQRNFSQFFVVDSFNIHRLVIAGVTCASKFFSDVFYTNSRYAKVGGLPLVELNHLELQFLLLNDFRLSVPVEELEAYGTMLVEFYAREIIAQQQAQQQMSSSYGSSDGIFMRGGSGSETTQTPTPP